MANRVRKLLVVQAAGLGYEFLRARAGVSWQGLDFRPAESVFPALTCTVQASFRTATHPEAHGVPANGLWDAPYARVRFWEQSAALVRGPRIWDSFRAGGGRVGLFFWQQSLGEAADTILSPAPIHKHHGGMIQDCYSRPAHLYAGLRTALGRPFNLARYWGPFASAASSQWIAEATANALGSDQAPDLCLTYLPALDYDLQRHGPDHPRAGRALACLMDQLALLKRAADARGYGLLVFGDYAFAPCGEAVFPNRALLDAGLMSERQVRGRSYPDLYASRAFAVADHEITIVYARDPADTEPAARALSGLRGVGQVIAGKDFTSLQLNPGPAGRLMLVAEEGFWFAYPWWHSASEEPDFAGHVDIHEKPGYDPCELFHGWPPGTVSRNTSRVKGTHGRTGPGRQIAWVSTLPLGDPATLVDLAKAVRDRLG